MELKPTDSGADISSLQKKSSFKKFGKIKNIKPAHKKLIKIGLIVLAVILLVVLIVKVSYNKGYKAGEKDGRKQVASTSSLLNNIKSPFQSISGKIAEIKDGKITIDTTKGEKKTVVINDKTKITKKRTTLKESDLKQKQSITVFTQGSGDDQKATRIVVRD